MYHVSNGKRSHAHSPRTHLGVEHLALRTEPLTLLDQVVNLLPPLQDALNRVVQHDLGLVELLLNLHSAVGILGVLVSLYVVLELRKRHLGALFCEAVVGGARVLGDKLVDDLSEDTVCGEPRIFLVGDDEPAYGVGVGIDVEHASCSACENTVAWEQPPRLPFSRTSICLFGAVLCAISPDAKIICPRCKHPCVLPLLPLEPVYTMAVAGLTYALSDGGLGEEAA